MASDVRFDIVANNKTQRAFQSVGKSLTNLRAGVNKSVGRVAKIGAAFSVAAIGATAALVKMRMAAIDNLAKTADKIGITTEALSGLQHAADLTGVSSETMNMALQRMTRRVAEAARGSGEAVGALDELGISAGNLQKLPLDQQMGVIADAMGEVKNQSDKVRLAMKLFDSEGVALVNTLAGGSKGLSDMASEADRLGLTITRIDAAQIEAANDSVRRAKGVFEGFANQLAVSLSPLVSELATNFYQVALDTNEAGNVGDRVAKALAQSFGYVADAVLGIKLAIKGIQLVFALFMETFINGIATMSSSFDILISGYNKVAEFFGKPTIVNAFKQNAEMLADSFGHVADGIKNDMAEALNAPLPSDQVMEFFDEVQLKARETAEVIAANSPAVVMAQQSEGMSVARNDTFIERAKMEGAQKLADFEKKTAADKTKFVVEQGATQFSALAAQSKKMFEVQKAFQIAQAVMNTYAGATQALAAYPPPLNFVFAALTVANGMAQVAQIRAQSFEGGGFTGMGARAGGLDGKGGYMAMVHPNETIIDHTKGQSAGMAAPVNVNFSIQANDTRDFDRLLTERRGVIVSLVNQALNNRGRSSLGRV